MSVSKFDMSVSKFDMSVSNFRNSDQTSLQLNKICYLKIAVTSLLILILLLVYFILYVCYVKKVLLES